MKKFLLTCCLFLSCVALFAAKALPTPVLVNQSDGSELWVVGHGDEHFNWVTTTDGVILKQQDKAYYVAAISEQGELTATDQLAHQPELRLAAELRAIARQEESKIYFDRRLSAPVTRAPINREPIQQQQNFFTHTGTPKALVLLVEFADTVFKEKDPVASFDQFLNGEGRPTDLGFGESRNYKSVSSYFEDMSFGQFKPVFDVKGPIKLTQQSAYYGNGKGMSVLFTDVVKACDGDINFKDYDANGDGKVDVCCIIYAGYSGSMTQNKADIWPNSAAVSVSTGDGVTVSRYCVTGERNGTPKSTVQSIAGIGIFCHEFSHTMGLPDIYATNSEMQTHDNQSMEYWDLMDGGEYLSSGRMPTPYTAWEREAFGWMEIETLSTPQQVALVNIDEGGKAYRIKNDQDATGNEYWILENIQNTKWNQAQHGKGLIIYHVDYDKTAFSLPTNNVNNTAGHPRFALVPADGKCLASANATDADTYYAELGGDPFPGTKNVKEIAANSTLPNMKAYNGDFTFRLPNINELNGTVYVDFNGVFATTGLDRVQETTPSARKTDDRIFTLGGIYVGRDFELLPAGVYIQNGRKVVNK